MPEDGEMPEELSGLDPEMVDRIMNEVMDNGDPTTFDDIAGLAHVKQTVIEVVVWPILNPQLFSGLRALPKGLLLFGPPGTGKTLIGKAVAAQSGATFFSVSASSLTSKWIGEGERMVRTMFAAARWRQPSVVFIDEIDSLLTARSETENEASRRIKTEFLVQMDGAGTRSDDRVLVIGATNRPGELDEAARRRFVKRLYVPLPGEESREALVRRLMSRQGAKHSLGGDDISEIVRRSKGYSGADLTQLCQAAAWAPLRELATHVTDITAVQVESIRAICLRDFKRALKAQGPSVAQSELARYESFDAEFGMAAREAGDDSDDSD
jgi:SpoVK/Ycf46/Vps4 family AAA+-type ATPase